MIEVIQDFYFLLRQRYGIDTREKLILPWIITDMHTLCLFKVKARNLALRIHKVQMKLSTNMLKLKILIENLLRKLQMKFYYISCLGPFPPSVTHFGFTALNKYSANIFQCDHLNLGFKMTARMRAFRINPIWQHLKPFS